MALVVHAPQIPVRRRARRAFTEGSRRSLILLLAATISVLAAYVCLAVAALGTRNAGLQWLNDIIELRRIFYERRIAGLPSKQSKIVIPAGSGTLFSVDTGLIERATGKPSFNLGLFAGFDIDLLFAQAIGWVGKGDRVIAPLEIEIYNYAVPTNYTGEAFLAKFYVYSDKLKPSHLLRIVTSISPSQVLGATLDLIEVAFRSSAQPKTGDAQRIADWQASRTPEGAAAHGPYDYSTMNDHGDKDLLRDPTPEQLNRVRSYATMEFFASTPDPWMFSEWASSSISYWRSEIEARGASLWLVWPILSEDESGTVFKEAFWTKLIDFAKQAAALGHPIYCDPVEAVTPIQYRYDTQYHFNIKGSDVFSRSLSACLKDIDHQAFDYAHADPKVLASRAKARIEQFKTPPDPLYFAYERNIRQLLALKSALDAARATDGRYPESLPAVDVASASSFPPAKLWYRSSGDGFKLLVEDPDECRIVRLAWPGMMDPVRKGPDDCGAYGYWTADAAGW